MPVSRLFAAALLIGLGSAAAVSQPAPPPPGSPLRVTTDTPEYCDELAGRVERARRTTPKSVPEVEQLAVEGQHMCDKGLIRGGLVRLRRALMLLSAEK